MIKVILSFMFLCSSIHVLSQKPKDGIYRFKYFDVEYNRFNGICKLIIKRDSINVYAIKDCHRTPGALIEKGLLIKDKSGRWIIQEQSDDTPSTIDFNKKIFYSF